MDERQIGLALVLRAAEVEIDVSTFHSRLLLQKAVYLLKAAGIRLGYSFNWYLRGPYSPALTRDLYDAAPNAEDVANWVLDNESMAIAARLKSILSIKTGETPASKASQLELYASIHYLKELQRLSVEDPDTATQQLAQNGKKFPEQEVRSAIQELQLAGLLD